MLAGCKHPTYSGLFTWKSNICKRKVPVQTQHSCWPLLARQKDPSPFRLSYATCNNAHPVQANRTVIPEFSFIKLVLVLHFPFAFVPALACIRLLSICLFLYFSLPNAFPFLSIVVLYFLSLNVESSSFT